MPLKNGHLTPRERSFAQHYSRTGDLTYAAGKAGFASAAGGWNAMQRPGVMAEVDRLYIEQLQGEVLPLAIKRHVQLLRDPETRGQVLNRAIETAYKHGFAKRDADDGAKEIHEMSHAEQLAMVRRVAEVIDLVPIEAAPVEVDPVAADPLFG